MVVPRTLRIGSVQDIIAAGMMPPLLLRPAGAHGGTGTMRIDDADSLARLDLGAAEIWYVSAFIDCRSTDGFVRKYRVIFVDRYPYPYHLAISDHWLVHYFSAAMADQDWKLEEEKAFLEDWRGVLGARNAAIIDSIGRALDLDYCGVDFGILPDGRMVIFEANSTMLVHPEDMHGKLADKNKVVGAIIDAFGRLLNRQA